jgi:hypothetical protein
VTSPIGLGRRDEHGRDELGHSLEHGAAQREAEGESQESTRHNRLPFRETTPGPIIDPGQKESLQAQCARSTGVWTSGEASSGLSGVSKLTQGQSVTHEPLLGELRRSRRIPGDPGQLETTFVERLVWQNPAPMRQDMKRNGRGRDWKVYRGGGGPEAARALDDGDLSRPEGSTDPLAIAEDMLKNLQAAELDVREMVRLLRE